MRLIACGVVLLLLGGCGTVPLASDMHPGGVGRYSKLVVVPLLADEVRVEWNDGLTRLAPARVTTGWETRDKAVRIVAELLAGSGTTVRGVMDVVGLLEEPLEHPDLASEVVRRLRETGWVGEGEMVLLLRQNAIDAQGRQYSPGRDFLLGFFVSPLLGPLSVVIGATTREDVYQPSFLLALNIGLHAVMVGPSCCRIGFDAVLVDAAGKSSLAEAKSIIGQEKVPDTLRSHGWEELSEAERQTAEAYCLAALRRALAEAANRLQLITPKGH